MADWLRKFKHSAPEEQPEDFVLLQQQEDVRDTSMDDTGEIPCIYDEMLSPAPKKKDKRKGWLLGIGIGVIVLAVIALLIRYIPVLTDPLRGYAQVEVTKGNVIDSFEASGTLAAGARYEITSLVSGKVVLSGFEAGEQVSAGSILYQLDDTEAKLAVERAKAQLARAKSAGTTAATPDKIYSSVDGTVYTVNIRPGGSVSYGQVVATIKKEDETLVAITSPYAGTVSAVYATQGKTVSINSLIAAVSSTTDSGRTSIYDQKSSQLDVEAAEAYLKNFTITSPIDGVVVEKNAKVGDNVGITDNQKPMMVILDTSTVKFTFRVNEYELRDISVGMKAVVKTESMPEESFAGEITRISSEGMPDENGSPLFEVDITIAKPGDLKPGMKVTATVIRDSANNVLYVPHKALMEADGQTALVLVKESNQGMVTTSSSVDETLSYPWIEVPEGCQLVRVSYGVADETNVEILFGLKLGDTIVYNPEAEPVDLTPAVTASPELMEGGISFATPEPTPVQIQL